MKILTTLSCLLTFIGIGFAQDMTPPAEIKNLSWVVGTWKGKVKMLTGPEPNADHESTMVYSMAVGGRYVQSNATISMGTMGSIEGTMMSTYDPDAKMYRAWWFDNTSSIGMEFTGELKGEVITFTSKPTNLPGMGETVMRATYTRKSDSELNFKLEMKQGDTFTPLMQGDYKKS